MIVVVVVGLCGEGSTMTATPLTIMATGAGVERGGFCCGLVILVAKQADIDRHSDMTNIINYL